MTHSATVVLALENIVGESLVWDFRHNRFYWVDIISRKIHAYDPDTRKHETWQTPDFVTSIGLAADGGFVVGLTHEIALWHPGGSFKTLATPEPDLPDNRLNEGVVGPDGAFWVGTMQNNILPNGDPRDITGSTGALYRVTADGEVTRISERTFGITNTLVWVGERLITADTLENALYSFSVSPQDGQLSDRRVIQKGFDRGLPDGSTQDAEGMVWNCRVVGGSCLVRLTPEGDILSLVDIPVSWPTSCAFGGRDLNRLFVTSARFTMDQARLTDNPQEGALIEVDTGHSGNPANLFG